MAPERHSNPKPQTLDLPDGAKRGGNCGVTAVAIAAGISFDLAWDLFKKNCPRIRRNPKWRGSTFSSERTYVMKKLGIKYEIFLNKKMRDEKTNRMPTLRKFVEWHTKPNTLYVVTTTHHVQLVMNGWVVDQGGPKSLNDFWGKNKRVEEVEVIIPKRKVASKSQYANVRLFPQAWLMGANPRKKGTRGWHAFEILLKNPGITYENYIAKGGRRQDLEWDLARKRITIIEKGN